MREYSVSLHFKTPTNALANFSHHVSCEQDSCMKDSLRKEYTDYFNTYYSCDDYTLINIFVESIPSGSIDYSLIDLMQATRSICELGHRVRAESKLKNRQPLKTAYVLFSDPDHQDYMVYRDAKLTYEDIFKTELNVLNVEFPDEQEQSKLFNYNIKPNFKVLGPKGFGKQAQGMKKHFESLSIEDRNALYLQFKSLQVGETIDVSGAPLTLSDIEVEFIAKKGYMSASGKVGAVILDTNLDDELEDMGFIAELKSCIQALRKDSGCKITDRIEIDIACSVNLQIVVNHFSEGLKGKLLATELRTSGLDSVCAGKKFYYHQSSIKDGEKLDSEVPVFDIAEVEEVFFVDIKVVSNA